MDWDEAALRTLMEIPLGVRRMVTEQVEAFAKEKGDERVTTERFVEMSAEYGIDEELLDRFRTGSESK